MEYNRYGDGWVRRADADHEWEAVPVDDVPSYVLSEDRARRERIRLGYDPDGPLAPGAKGSARILENPALDAIAEELGLTAGEVRGRLNGDTGGTRKRVTEERFDEIATSLGLTPEEARDRFRQ